MRATVQLQFPLGDEPPPCASPGSVVRMAAPSQYGVEFTRLGPDAPARIRHFLETLEQA